MALEAIVFPHDMFNYNNKNKNKERCSLGWSYDMEKEGKMIVAECGNDDKKAKQFDPTGDSLVGINWDDLTCSPPDPLMVQKLEEWDANSSHDQVPVKEEGIKSGQTEGRRKRRRTKTCKNKEEMENQRMTHIAVERNRRKQMNDYLSMLRTLMPSSYIQRGDQASIIGGAINFVKELEQLLQCLEAKKQIKQQCSRLQNYSSTTPFSNFFAFPQYSMEEKVAQNRSPVADIEVSMVENHANIKVLSRRRRPRQLHHMVVGLQSQRLTLLHLNLTTFNQMVLYSFSVKVEDHCLLSSADEIATEVHGMLCKIQDDPTFVS